MPLGKKGKSILAKFAERYGSKKGKSVMYATMNTNAGLKKAVEGGKK